MENFNTTFAAPKMRVLTGMRKKGNASTPTVDTGWFTSFLGSDLLTLPVGETTLKDEDVYTNSFWKLVNGFYNVKSDRMQRLFGVSTPI